MSGRGSCQHTRKLCKHSASDSSPRLLSFAETRRKRLFETLVRFGHPVWSDYAPKMPVKRERPTIAEECEIMYGKGVGSPPVRARYGR